MKSFRIFVLLVPLCISLAISPSSQAKVIPKAFNEKICTVIDSAGKDNLKGTSKADVICGLVGNDVISGLGGNNDSRTIRYLWRS